ncbi:putative uncharacterized protein [Prevotella sp. CAG:755]|nr:putative uncharacterized protein [Prevotella sp. CAG:755]
MKQPGKLKDLIYGVGGLLLAAGAFIYSIPALTPISPYVYSVGAVCFASMQMLSRYDGRNLVLRRLRRQQLFSAVLLLLVAPLMFMNVLRVGPLRGDTWIVLLTIAAIYQVYTSFRIASELQRDSERH